jgi:hypothetical protein
LEKKLIKHHELPSPLVLPSTFDEAANGLWDFKDVGRDDGRVEVWRRADHRLAMIVGKSDGAVRNFRAVTPDGRFAATAIPSKQRVEIWDKSRGHMMSDEEYKRSITEGAWSRSSLITGGLPSATISHDPYTHVTMRSIGSGRIHRTEAKPDAKMADSYKPKEPVVVADISKVQFNYGPHGESMEMDVNYGEVHQRGYYYRNRDGQNVLHGPRTQFGPGDKVTVELLYVHGVVKSMYRCYGEKPELIEQYRGDENHTRVEYSYYPNGSLKRVARFRVAHERGNSAEVLRPIPHGLSVAYYDNGLVEKAGQTDERAGMMKEELFEDGQSVGFVVYDRQGGVSTSSGKMKR